MTAARPLYCEHCGTGVPAMCVTPEGNHDTMRGGCGNPVKPLELPPGAPQAFGVFARMGDRMVLQWPPRVRMRDALVDADRFTPGTPIEVRPLMDAPAPDVAAFMLHIEKLTDLVLTLETRLQAHLAGDTVPVERARLAALLQDAERLDLLEQLGNERSGLVLHRGVRFNEASRGLGLSGLGRTLREAVDALRSKQTGSCDQGDRCVCRDAMPAVRIECKNWRTE